MAAYAVEMQSVSKSYGPARSGDAVQAVAGIDLAIHAGEFFTLLGPSGCGKTTTLRLIGGFEMPTTGRVLVGGADMSRVPAHLRPVNTVFQSYALFPHLTVEENVGFGLSLRRIPGSERRRRVDEALALVQMAHMGSRRPRALSGGQQQRVALARALVNRPSVLLLDEPLGALDLKLRKEMQIELRWMQRQLGITFVFVTHDQEEALTMSDRIAVMRGGVILQVDDPIGIYERPTSRFGAEFIGDMNFLPAIIAGIEAGELLLTCGDVALRLPVVGGPIAPGAPVTLAVRPEALVLAPWDEPYDAGMLHLSGMVGDAVYIGTDWRHIVTLDSGPSITVRSQNSGRSIPVFAPGTRVTVRCSHSAMRLFNDQP